MGGNMAKAKATKTARRRTTVVTDEVGGGDEVELGNGVDAAPAIDGDPLADLLGIAAEDIVFKAYKQPEKAGEKAAYAGSYTGEELSLDTIRDTYGGGTYRITAFNGKNQYRQSKVVTILGLPKSAAPAQVSTNSSLAETMLLKMMEQQTALMQAIAARPQADSKQPTVMEIISLIKAMEPKHQTSEVDTLLKGIALAKDMGGGAAEPGLMDVAMKGLTAITMAQQQQPPAPMPIAAQPAPAALPAPKQNPKEPQDMNLLLQMKRLNWLKATVTQLVVQASKQKDPELYAEVFLDNLPEFIDEAELLTQFEKPDAIDTLAGLGMPDVKKYPQWFEAFRNAVLAAYADDAAAAGDEKLDELDAAPGESLE